MQKLNRELWQRDQPSLLDRALDVEPSLRAQFLRLGPRRGIRQLAAALERLLAEHPATSWPPTSSRPCRSSRNERRRWPVRPSASTRWSGPSARAAWAPSGWRGGPTDASKGRRRQAAEPGPGRRPRRRAVRREGTLLARLTHPHIARLLDAGVTTTGQPYLVLEYVDGARIDRYCDLERLELIGRARAVPAGRRRRGTRARQPRRPPRPQAGERAGRRRRAGQAARLRHRQAARGETWAIDADRAAGAALTPEYAAPEQAVASRYHGDRRLRARRVLLYQLLVGRHPTAPDDDPTHVEILRALAEREPRGPSAVVSQMSPGRHRLPGAS